MAFRIAPNFVVQNFREIAKNHNFLDKNFMIATFFRDYLCATESARTIHIVALPIILTCDVGACKCEEK